MVGWGGSAQILSLHEILHGWSVPGPQELIETAFSHADRSFNSLYKGLLLRETKFKMAQAICRGGIFSSLLLHLSLSFFPSLFPSLSPFLSLNCIK